MSRVARGATCRMRTASQPGPRMYQKSNEFYFATHKLPAACSSPSTLTAPMICLLHCARPVHLLPPSSATYARAILTLMSCNDACLARVAPALPELRARQDVSTLARRDSGMLGVRLSLQSRRR